MTLVEMKHQEKQNYQILMWLWDSWVAWLFLPHLHVLSFNWDTASFFILDYQASSISYLLRIPPTHHLSFCPFLHWFTIPLFYNSTHPPIPLPTGVACCAREEFAQLLLLPEDATINERADVFYSICHPITGFRMTRKAKRKRGVSVALFFPIVSLLVLISLCFSCCVSPGGIEKNLWRLPAAWILYNTSLCSC